MRRLLGKNYTPTYLEFGLAIAIFSTIILILELIFFPIDWAQLTQLHP